MARHIMAVCVVCLLCADRLPCQQHVSTILATAIEANLEQKPLNAKVFQRTDAPSRPNIDNTDAHSDSSYYYNPSPSEKQPAQQRRKRHLDHAPEATPQQPEITEYFLQRIFDDYGHGDGTINATGFQHMLRQLGLQQFVEQLLSKNSSDKNNNESCIVHSELVHHIQAYDLGHHKRHLLQHPASDSKLKSDNGNCSLSSNASSMCANTQAQHNDHNQPKINYTLNTQDMLNMCPLLLYQLAAPADVKQPGCMDRSVLEDIENYVISDFSGQKQDIIYVWMYAFISVFACSILGLVGVAIIPFMDSSYYKHIIQFLVSLAVGTMTGDALLHLMPHSLAGQDERNMIFKGLICMSGIVFFYITEHGLTMISEWRKAIAKRETKIPSRAKVMRDPDSSINNSVAGDKLCKSKYSSYPYCYDEIAMDTKNDVWLHLPNNVNETHDGSNNVDRKRNGKSEVDVNETAAQSLLSTSQNNYAPIAEMNHHHHHQHHDHQQQQFPDSNTISTDLDANSVGEGGGTSTTNGNNGGKEKAVINDTVTVILREHESSHHGHSHKHGHVHSPPESLSAVAWMIIMGDGLHNFTDGMAIGAAFAENIAGGFSTSLAVFCHELPHELGDFAILIKAGMSVKSAVYYNLLTGILSFIGMICGIVFGQSQDVAQWMFAAAAGLFIYIALVDMMPELTASHKSIEQFVLQILGMSSGVLIMLLIALYETDLMNIFSTSSSSSLSGRQHIH